MKVVLLIKYSDKKNHFQEDWPPKLTLKTENVKLKQSSIKMPYKISKSPFRRLIQMQKSIEFQLHN